METTAVEPSKDDMHHEIPTGHVDDPMNEWSSFWNLFFFNQSFPAVRCAAKQTLTQKELKELTKLGTAEHASFLHSEISNQDSNLPLWRHLASAQSSNLWLGAVSTLLNAVGLMVLPLLVGEFVGAVQQKSDDGWQIALSIVVIKIAMSFADQLSQHVGWRLGQRVRATIIGSVYRAALVLTGSPPNPSSGDGDSDHLDGAASRLLNLASNDAQKLYEVAPMVHQLWAAPLMITVACALLIWLLGAAALAGIAMLFVLGPLNVFVLGKFSQLRKAHLPLTDARVSQLSEAIRSMRMIKFFSWENPLYKALFAVRAQELRYVKRELHLFASNIGLMITFPVWATTTALAIFALDNNLTSADAFSALLFFTILRFPLNQLGMVAAAAVQGKVALQRLEQVMHAQQEELQRRAAASRALVTDCGGGGAGGDAALADTPHEMHAVGAHKLDSGTYSAVVTRMDGLYCRWIPRGRPAANAAAAAAAGPEVPPATLPAVGDVVSAAQEALIAQKCVSPCVRLHSCRLHWGGGSGGGSGDQGAFALSGVDLTLSHGDLLAVVGPVGSGKSTLAAGLLGECALQREEGAPARGAVQVRGGVAYVPQNAWVLNASVRDNILFGRRMDAAAYRCTLWASALLDDLAIMPGGDLTMIGENGITISGGQQQRVSLARAVYACLVQGDDETEPRASVLLADDPLSALDAHTGATVFHRVFSHNGVLRHTTRILMTHAVQYVVDASTVLALRGGRVVWQGPFQHMGKQVHLDTQRSDLGEQEADDLKWLQAAVLAPLADEGHLGGGPAAEAAQSDGRPPSTTAGSADAITVEDLVGSAPVEGCVSEGALTRVLGGTGDTLMTNEDQAQGSLSMAVVAHWIKAAGGWGMIVWLVATLVLERSAFATVDWWLAVWTQAADEPGSTPVEGLPELTTESRRNFYVPGYVVLTAVMTVFVFVRCHSWAVAGAAAADGLADGMLRRILRAPVAFFDTTPAGRIISRCAHDVETIDFLLVRNLMAAIASVGWMASGFIVMIAFSPWSAVVLVPVWCVFFYMQSVVRNALRDLQRLDNITRSPITAHLSETLAGSACIRAYGPAAAQRFVVRSDALTDVNTSAVVMLKTVNRYLGIRVDLLASLIVAAVCFVSYFNRENMSEGLAGLVVVYSFNVTVSLTFFIQFGVDLESKLVSVERIKHYTDTIAPEASLHGALTPQAAALQLAENKNDSVESVATAEALVAELSADPPARPETVQLAVGGGAPPLVQHVPPANWPSAGEVVFKDVCLRYRPGLPLALRNMSFSLPAGSHVGICGRTGAGKSSISVALFRLVELAGGSIEIDGVPLHSIGLSYLRGQANGICIVPQAPTLVAASVRDNLDRFKQHSDEEVIEALSAVQMLHKCWTVAESDKGGAEKGVEGGASAADTAAAAAEQIELQMVPEQLAAATPEPAGSLSPEQQVAALHCEVSEGGGNFSVGEAQLLCLARALLRKPKVLVMDEASASVDAQTENTLVRTVRERFRGTTVLTIAHRLFTLVHSDSILLLHEGQVQELDSPAALLRDPSSRFSGLVDAMGAEAASAFRAAVGVSGADPKAETK